MAEAAGLPDRQAVIDQALSLGFHLVGIAAVEPEPSPAETAAVGHLQTWLGQGHQADMDWMANPRRQNIRQVLPGARSLVCVALNYYTPHRHSPDPRHGKISRYAWGRDYHRVLHKRLKALADWLTTAGQGTVQARYYADTGPVQDKAWAQQAGLGWVAKNGNLITRQYGSWVFLGELVTTLALVPDAPHTAHCGTCTRCLEACPTGAIAQPYVVDANRCIAYHTIENRGEKIPEAIAPHLQNWVAGCDICQDVCPWNQRFAQPTTVDDFQPRPENLAPNLDDLANLSEADWDSRFRASALRRIKPAMWRRNARAAQKWSGDSNADP
ncbi:tRNA epoxyqueuosine(34) reductase QueG [Leptolyngbya sp. CCNP1308]|uniref:tRNA epoxyqueuosine(34) reductase QueG n=1 Tax=Leptolyngbya sp. CCNP1308 TaxID=3110255 RepID=UPI002B21AE3B|nr:tRNA epoxyqueuosine(34) reductase QueG [Leptolyngbya sp. CCNP1308]MEA5452616.1 tRNA epoxyqueuosine(34) reductase QueG [Leptolyngbya sp. CCNP1308]